MTNEIDRHLGKRLRQRRRTLGLTQQQIAEAVGVRFQQIQKYECGANRFCDLLLREAERTAALTKPLAQMPVDLVRHNYECPVRLSQHGTVRCYLRKHGAKSRTQLQV